VPKHDPNCGDAIEWLKFALDDLRQARDHPPGLYNLTGPCFHAQQAAEKALKAVCIAKQVRFGITHDLGVLEQALEEHGIDAPEEVFNAIKLSAYATARYPSRTDEQPSEADLAQAVLLAQGVISWASRMIGSDL
jgi:HEPN domain-containing protein